MRNVKRKKYIDLLDWKIANVVMKVKLNMIEVKGNFKGSFVKQGLECPVCKNNEDTTEHIFQCKELIKRIDKNVNKEDIYMKKNVKS